MEYEDNDTVKRTNDGEMSDSSLVFQSRNFHLLLGIRPKDGRLN